MSGPYPPGRASTLKFGHLLIQHTGCGCRGVGSDFRQTFRRGLCMVGCLFGAGRRHCRPAALHDLLGAPGATPPTLLSLRLSSLARSIQRVRFFFFILLRFFSNRTSTRTGTAKGLVRRVGLLPTQHLPCALQRRPTERPAGGVRTHSPRHKLAPFLVLTKINFTG